MLLYACDIYQTNEIPVRLIMVEFIPQHTNEYKTRIFVHASFSWQYTVRILVSLNHDLLVLAVLNQTFETT